MSEEAVVVPHDDATCQMCFWRNNVRCNICDYLPPACDRSRYRGERFNCRILQSHHVLFLCALCDESYDAAGLEQRVRELRAQGTVMLPGQRRFMGAFTERGIMNPEEEGDFQEVEVSDPMGILDLALEFIPEPSANLNYLLAAITSEPSLDPWAVVPD
jgi:hypothetical protein